MMKAKDTVMGERDIVAFRAFSKLDIHNGKEVLLGLEIAKEQAEISFPMGKQEGKREVVEYVNHFLCLSQKNDYIKWRDKLKEWGIGDEG